MLDRTAARRSALTLIILAFAAHPARADIINPPISDTLLVQIEFFSPLGQTFTAVDADISVIGFNINVLNNDQPNNALTVSLYDGVGTGGTLLGTTSTVAPLATDGFFNFDFSSIPLLILGAPYTAMLDAGGSPLWGVRPGQPYAGGVPLVFGAPAPPDFLAGVPSFDWSFQVLAAKPIPEPSSLLLSVSAAAIWFFCRNRRGSRRLRP